MESQPNQASRCPQCRRPFGPGHARCLWCGADLRGVALPDLELKCATCAEKLGKHPLSDGFIHICPGCGGTWISPGVLERIEELYAPRREKKGSETEIEARKSLQHEGIRDSAPSERLYRACPQCGGQMARRRYGHVSDVVADSCLAHGTWFDATEFQRVLAFLDSGGLERSREFEERTAKSFRAHSDWRAFVASLTLAYARRRFL